jgi:putative ABC transport system substrate-binding protein
MNRRAFVTGLGAALAAPLGGEAQRATKVNRVGVLLPTPISRIPGTGAFKLGLRDLGYIEGQNLVLEYRSIDADKLEQLPALAAELVTINVDIIFAIAAAAHAAKNATATIPIVFAGVGDPVRTGLITSLARPGGNVTGLTNTAPDLSGKRLQLLKDLVPSATRVALLWNAANPIVRQQLPETEAAAVQLKTQLHMVAVRNADDFESAFLAMTTERVGALVVIADVLTLQNRERIASLAIKNRLPTISEVRDFAISGGLAAYGPDAIDIARRAAGYVDISKHVGRVNRDSTVIGERAA